MCVPIFACSSLFPDLQASGSLPFPKSAAAVATSLKKPITPGKPNLHVRPFKKQESENTDTKPPSPVSKAPPSVPIKPRSPSPARDAPPLPPPSKSIPDKPAPAPYSQVKPNTNVSNGTKLGFQEDQQSSGDEDDDIYDDAISNRDPLLGEPWYFKSLKDRKTGDKLLRKVGKDGTFLIRESTKQGHIQPYTMMVLFQNNIYNLKIRVRPDGKMALGEEKPDEMSFMDVQKLVKYHRETEVILVGNTGQHKTLLKCSPPQNAL
uniref:SH2 domain-containing protein n=1 Tax=Magallana gigas TaxID=29159 RepID=A0A8W8II12_MAGGI